MRNADKYSVIFVRVGNHVFVVIKQNSMSRTVQIIVLPAADSPPEQQTAYCQKHHGDRYQDQQNIQSISPQSESIANDQ